jgi:hypothetical protein
MGGNSILDLIGSFIIGGMVIVMAMRLNSSAVETSTVYHGELKLQQNLTTLVEVMENDFRKIGYCADHKKIPEPARANLLADSTRYKFLTDLDSDGQLDSVFYYVGVPGELTDTPNPRDCYLYRVVNTNTPEGWNLGVTRFRFRYFNALGDTLTFPIAEPREVFAMEISIALESADPMEQKYLNDPSAYEVFWKQIRVASRNLRNR